MTSRMQALHWAAAGQTLILYGTIGVVLFSLISDKDVIFVVWGSQTLLWAVLALIGRGRGGLIGVPRDELPVEAPRPDLDLPMQPRTFRTMLIGLALYALVGVAAVLEAVGAAPKEPVLTTVLAIDALVIVVYGTYVYRRLSRRLRRPVTG